jgi:hypothetical protein
MLYLVWLTVTMVVMVLHYRLFKRGVCFNHMRGGDEDKRFACFEFCRGPTSNPAAKTLTSLASMIFAPDVSGDLKLLRTRYGRHASEWPLAVLTALHVSVVVAFARLWRLLFYHFQHYPWLLAPAFDPDVAEEDQRACGRKFLAIDKGSKQLDPGLGRRLREIVDTEEQLFGRDLRDFMETLFKRLVVTSTFVERIFKDLTLWTGVQAQTVESIGAKHVNDMFQRNVGRWRASLSDKRKGTTGKERPPWMKSLNAGTATTGYHYFKRGMRQVDLFNGKAAQAWAILDPVIREEFERKAAHARTLASVRPTPLDNYMETMEEKEIEEGPWCLSSRNGKFAMNAGVVERALENSTMQQISKNWQARFEAKVLPDPEFTGSSVDGAIDKGIPAAQQGIVEQMLENMRLALRFADRDHDAGLMLEFQHGDETVYALAPHCLHIERKSFEGEFFRMVPLPAEAASSDVALPMVLQYLKQGEGVLGHWPCIETETQFTLHLVELAEEVWQMYLLNTRPISMCRREVLGRTHLHADGLRELEQEYLAAQAAMKVFRLSNGLTARSTGGPKGRKGRGSGRGGRARGRTGGLDLVAVDAPVRPNRKVKCVDTSHSSPSETSESGAEKDRKEDTSVLKGKLDALVAGVGGEHGGIDPPAGCGEGESASSGSGGVMARALSEALRRHLAGRAAPGEKVMEVWGDRFPFAEIKRKGVFVGYGVTCALHVNADGEAGGTPCKKSITIGGSGISLGEARLRLKRWLVAGKFHALDPAKERKSHIALGGLHLSHLGGDQPSWSDFPEDDLDALIATL